MKKGHTHTVLLSSLRVFNKKSFYIFKDSIPSLGAGLFFGSILGFGAYQVSQDTSNIALFLNTSTALGALMGYRYWNTGKIMPAGVIAILRYLIPNFLLKLYYRSL